MKNRLHMQYNENGVSRNCVGLSKLFEESGPELLNLFLAVHIPLIAEKSLASPNRRVHMKIVHRQSF